MGKKERQVKGTKNKNFIGALKRFGLFEKGIKSKARKKQHEFENLLCGKFTCR